MRFTTCFPNLVEYGSEEVGDATRALPDTSGSFLEKTLMVSRTSHNNYLKSHETSTGRKTVFVLENYTNKTDAHRQDLNFGGPMSSPSSIWSPIVKKTSFNKHFDFTSNYPPTTGRRWRRKNFPRAPNSHPPCTQGQHILWGQIPHSN